MYTSYPGVDPVHRRTKTLSPIDQAILDVRCFAVRRSSCRAVQAARGAQDTKKEDRSS